MNQLDGYLGTIIGAAVGALISTGHSPAEVHEWVDMAIKARQFAPEDARFAEAARLITESAGDMHGG